MGKLHGLRGDYIVKIQKTINIYYTAKRVFNNDFPFYMDDLGLFKNGSRGF